MTWVSRQISPLSEDMISEETMTRYKEPVSKWRGIQLTVCDGVGGGEVVAVVCFLKTINTRLTEVVCFLKSINTRLTETNGGQEVRGARKASHPGQNDPRDYNWQSLHTSYLAIVNISFVSSYLLFVTPKSLPWAKGLTGTQIYKKDERRQRVWQKSRDISWQRQRVWQKVGIFLEGMLTKKHKGIYPTAVGFRKTCTS